MEVSRVLLTAGNFHFEIPGCINLLKCVDEQICQLATKSLLCVEGMDCCFIIMLGLLFVRPTISF